MIQTVIKRAKLNKFTLNYIDDILIYSKNMKEHLEHVERVLTVLMENGIKLKKEKCHFAQKEVKYLGHIVGNNWFKPMNSNVKAIEEFPRPVKLKNVQQFLGKINYYRKFVPNITETLNPLYRLLKKGTTFEWKQEQEEAFEKVKKYITKEPVLRIYNSNEKCYLYTDASRIGIGAILKQKQDDGVLHPVGYFSKKLLPYQMNYYTTELECLAIVESINYWHHYLYGREFLVTTDHKALKYLNSFKYDKQRLMEWSMKLSMYTFEVKYRKGSENEEADCLSRNPIDEAGEMEDCLKIVNLVNLEDIREETLKENKKIKKSYMEDGIIYRKDPYFKRIYVPKTLRRKLIWDLHKEYCHIGVKQMVLLMSKRYYFENLDLEISKELKRCETCIMNKTRWEKIGHLSRMEVKKPFDMIVIDTISGFNNYGSKKRHMHMAIDAFSKYVWVTYAKGKKPEDIINLLQKVFKVRKPRIILVDRYSTMKSSKLQKFIKKVAREEDRNIKLIFTVANSPHSLGVCERANQTIVNRLRCQMYDTNFEEKWTKVCDQVVEKYNDTPHSLTNHCPKELVECKDKKTLDKIKVIYDRKHFQDKERFDRKRKPMSFEDGTTVYSERRSKLNRRKLSPLREGPFRVKRKIGSTLYELSNGNKLIQGHITKMAKLG